MSVEQLHQRAQFDGERLRGLPQGRKMAAVGVQIVDASGAQRRIVNVARFLLVEPAESGRQRLGQRDIERPAHVVAQTVAVTYRGHAGLQPPAYRRGGGINGDKLYESADTARAIERSLRPSQYLDPGEVAGIDIRWRIAPIERRGAK